MNASDEFLGPADAARRLGISTKTLRIYEEHGLIVPARTEAGWRAYGPDQIKLAARIVGLRELGLSLRQVAKVIAGEPAILEAALAAHQTALENESRRLAETINKVRDARAGLASCSTQFPDALNCLLETRPNKNVRFVLPWPWGGETFELNGIGRLNFITGPLGSGKTRFANKLAAAFPDATFLGLERLSGTNAETRQRFDSDNEWQARAHLMSEWIAGEGGTVSDALLILLIELAAECPAILVIDMIEQDLAEATQRALIACLRHGPVPPRPLFMLTRSSAILDLELVKSGEQIIYCPANHSIPMNVAPFPGAPGYEAVATCLATPSVRARTEGVIAWRPTAN